MTFEILAVALNASSPSGNPTPSAAFDYLAVGAFLISLSTLGFTIWNASRTRRSEQHKIARELMYSIFECRKILDTFYDRYWAHAPNNDQGVPPRKNVENRDRSQEFYRTVTGFMYEIEEFRMFAIFQKIEKRSEILIYKLRLHSNLEYVRIVRAVMDLEDPKTKESLDRWIDELKKWSREGNENRIPSAEAKA